MLLKDLSVLILDCQTTGASPQYGVILELGWSLYNPGQTEAVTITNRLIKLPSDAHLPERIKKITGITDSDMLTALPGESVIDELALFLPHNLTHAVPYPSAVSIAIAHYAQFEQSFVSHFYSTHGHDNLPFTFICTCQIAKRLFPHLPSRAIRALGGYLGLTIEEEKRSSGHVLATSHIWRELIPRLAAQDVHTYDDLVQFLASPVPRKKPGSAPYELPIERLKRLEVSESPGVYKMLSLSGKILYVGKATSLKSRVNSYFRGRRGKDSKTKELISQIHDIETIEVATPLEAALLETDLIKEHNPPYNRALRERGRDLVFYNHDFTLVSSVQDEECYLGPFVSEQSMLPILSLVDGLESGEFDPAMFWGLAQKEIIEEGVALFIDNYLDLPVEPSDVEHILSGQMRLTADVTVREMIALGMRLWRTELNLALAAERAAKPELETGGDTTGGVDLDLFDLESAALRQKLLASDLEGAGDPDLSSRAGGVEGEDEKDEEEDEVVDAFAIEELIVGILVRSARLYLQAKQLNQILNCQVYFKEGELPLRKLKFEGGKITQNIDVTDASTVEEQILPLVQKYLDNKSTSVKSKKMTRAKKLSASFGLVIPDAVPDLPWQNLNLDTFDRLRVLMTELGRLVSGGKLLPLRRIIYRGDHKKDQASRDARSLPII